MIDFQFIAASFYGAHSVSCLARTGDSLSMVKLSEREAGHSPPCNAEVSAYSYTSTPQYVSMARCLVKRRGYLHRSTSCAKWPRQASALKVVIKIPHISRLSMFCNWKWHCILYCLLHMVQHS